MKKFINSFGKGILISLIPIVAASIAIGIISSSDTPVVKYVTEYKRPGYETEPAKYIVEASYAKYWHDSRIVLLIILAYLIFLVGTVYVVHTVNDKEIDSKGGNIMLAVVWIVGLLLIFVPMAFKYGSSSYQSTLTVQEYEANKNNLDALFPSIEGIRK
jgi:hypothetical protein